MTSNDAAAPIAWSSQERRHQPKNLPLEISNFINTICQFRTFAVLEYPLAPPPVSLHMFRDHRLNRAPALRAKIRYPLCIIIIYPGTESVCFFDLIGDMLSIRGGVRNYTYIILVFLID